MQEHSRYEDDALGRLAGTTQWLTVVTFGDQAQADRECARVRGLHRRVKGDYNDDGHMRPYSAMDPDLLRWVHVAFTDSFLATHRVWGGPIPGGEDAYVREWALAGELVGVTDPPRSVAELEQQLADFEPVLRRSDASDQTVRFIRQAPLPLPARPPYSVLLAGAASTLPAHYRHLLGLPFIPLAVTKPAVGALLGAMGAVLGRQSPSQRCDRREDEPHHQDGRRDDLEDLGDDQHRLRVRLFVHEMDPAISGYLCGAMAIGARHDRGALRQ